MKRHFRYPHIFLEETLYQTLYQTLYYLIGYVTLSVRSSECDEPVPELLLSLSNSLYDDKK